MATQDEEKISDQIDAGLNEQEEKVKFITGRFPDAHAFQWALHSWVIKSTLCGQIGLYRKTENEAWDACYELLKSKS